MVRAIVRVRVRVMVRVRVRVRVRLGGAVVRNAVGRKVGNQKSSSKITATMSQKNVVLDVRRGGKLKIHPGVRHPSYATYCR